MPQKISRSFLLLWLDRILIFDFFLVVAGSFWLILAVFANSQGISPPLLIFQKLWKPIFIPAISLLLTGTLMTGVIIWLRQKGLALKKDIEN